MYYNMYFVYLFFYVNALTKIWDPRKHSNISNKSWKRITFKGNMLWWDDYILTKYKSKNMKEKAHLFLDEIMPTAPITQKLCFANGLASPYNYWISGEKPNLSILTRYASIWAYIWTDVSKTGVRRVLCSWLLVLPEALAAKAMPQKNSNRDRKFWTMLLHTWPNFFNVVIPIEAHHFWCKCGFNAI